MAIYIVKGFIVSKRCLSEKPAVIEGIILDLAETAYTSAASKDVKSRNADLHTNSSTDLFAYKLLKAVMVFWSILLRL